MTLLKPAWLACCLLSPSLVAAAKPAAQPPAETLLHHVLQAEATGSPLRLDRRTELEPQRLDATSFPELWWQSGYVRIDDQWRPWEDTVEPVTAAQQEYRVRRGAVSSSAKDQLQLAAWCDEHEFTAEARVHKLRALSTGQVQDAARVLVELGYRPVGNRWFTEAELQQYRHDQQAAAREFRRLQPRLDHLMPRLEGHPRQRPSALDDLRSLVTPQALPVLEVALGSRGEITSHALVDVLSQVDSYRSSQVLARLAILSNWESVRASAATALTQRPWEDFVPMTLEYLHTPFELRPSVAVVRPTRNAWREWRFLFARENRETIEVASFQLTDTSILVMNRGTAQRPRMVYVDNLQDSHPLKLEADARRSLETLHQQVVTAEQMNDVTQHINERTGSLLAQVSQQPASSDPVHWWNWWDQNVMDVVRIAPKPVVVVSETQQLFGPPPVSCIAAGTPVWTSQGFMAIEKIKPGDRVLSKCVNTGELAYKSVLETTHRRDAHLRKISMTQESVEASPGHHFWIAGRGWTRTLLLTNEMRAHTTTGRTVLTIEDLDRTADVYNLVVDDFHTYFVGKTMILTHDVFPPAPTDHTVPGLQPNVY